MPGLIKFSLLTLHVFFPLLFSHIVLLSVSLISQWWSPWLQCSKKIKSTTCNLNFLSQNMQRKTREKQPLDVSLSTPREWEMGEKNQTELQCPSEEDSNRDRLPGGGRRKASEELEIKMRGRVISKRACHERVSRKMIRVMEKQMYEWQQRWGVCSECWLDKLFPPLQQLNLQKTIVQRDVIEFTEKLAKFVTFSFWIFVRKN